MALQQKRCELEELGCGGCALLSLPYEKQLQKKQKELKALLGKYRKPVSYTHLGARVCCG